MYKFLVKLYQKFWNTDPETSVKAGRKPRPGVRQRVLEAIRSAPNGLTGHEIAEITGIQLNSVTPRFAELIYAGVIYREDGNCRNGQTVWMAK